MEGCKWQANWRHERQSDIAPLDSRMYEVEYNDGHTACMPANLIAENLAGIQHAAWQPTILQIT
eukprot:CAMPEP_0119022882 /NCGR_PEP_ID=MMETSP1176-20130426/28937_1 /TAXON_ID=265551 /ORGANISM="Synedropsis recta cf, Strain CCMP1620" /LENGTH=63 /DNA_ID=CAMNT_0006977837 /DNA_START=931 /DNA_END=1119 /DNA_ORIENTATION=-